ncbi:diacylglycerol/lipid kinase family protein [Salegentibacter salegens]|uniref:Lipid kinase, YegS/Rv2252/BmrU family n=1 Tax=Salegentibacter salegens TaxID=143223 RepID=A0A1M7JTJ8_9FLAO|nr:YegS/Rv2252/BmrU family lipid kinase [Salegentibacter salegens]PRX51935.1 YegS/Rv2252/BmrU family lipid kinase [Salegentibacter salegens]SHM56430.1 lipid kinase, YegS/Rv2252/BmrU family [Salegentibacter salegens]
MKEIQKVLLIVNPISGDLNKKNIIETVENELLKINARLITFKTTGENDQDKIKKLVAENTFDRVFIAGGDGTIKQVAEALIDFLIPIAIFPAGSANGLAVNLGIPINLEEQLKIALGNKHTEMDMLEINGELCLHISDLGLNAELIKNYEHSRIRGKMGYLLQSIPTLWESKYPFEFEIELNNKRFTRKGILLAFANAKKYGTGANVNPKGKIDDGVFEILLFKNFDVLEILKTLRNETDVNSEFVEIIPVKSARVFCRKPVAFQIDGEYIGEKEEISVKISPKKLPIMTY